MNANIKKIIENDFENIPEEKMPMVFQIIHTIMQEIAVNEKKNRGSLKGLWGEAIIDDALFSEAKSSLFPYGREK